MRYLPVALILAGCSAPMKVPDDAGRDFTIEHSSVGFEFAMAGAKEHCAKMGMRARHLGTDRAQMLLSRFECVK